MNYAELLQGHLPLSHLGVLRAQGPDAAHFLHNQLTQDMVLLKDNEARLAGYCSAKGRLLASFVVLRWQPDDFVLVCSRDILTDTMKRLQMFVMRAKVKIFDASDELMVHGLMGESAAKLLDDPTPWRKTVNGNAQIVALYPGCGVTRALCVATPDSISPDGPLLRSDLWNWARVRSAVGDIQKPLVDLFVPQMLNYESVGGVSFKKGCYPGQEVVARSQFRGTLKRRTFLVHLPSPADIGSALFHSADSDQPCGTVVDCAPHPNGQYDALVCLQVAATTSGAIHLGQPDGPLVQLLELPYPLEADI